MTVGWMVMREKGGDERDREGERKEENSHLHVCGGELGRDPPTYEHTVTCPHSIQDRQ